MFRKFRIAVLLLILFVVAADSWLTRARSTDWNNSLWVKVYPINADGSSASQREIDNLKLANFEPVQAFMARELEHYGRSLQRPVRMELGSEVREQPPQLPEAANRLDILWWSLRMRLWASDVADDDITPDVRIFMRYHDPGVDVPLENSVGIQKGMFGIVNAFAGRDNRGRNNVVLAHEFLHTLGASDKYQPATGQPIAPNGLADPERQPLYPQVKAEIMGGRIALSADTAVIPDSLRLAMIGPLTAREIGLIDE